MTKKKQPLYEKLAKDIYSFMREKEEDISFGDAVASLELVKLWIHRDYMNLHYKSKEENVETIEV